MKVFFGLLCTLVASTSFAADIDPVNPSQILQELQSLQAKHDETSTVQQKQKIDTVLRAAASKEAAIAFYEDAQMATQFQGTSRENGEFRDWKKQHEIQLKDPAFRESVRLHLFYLSLTLKKAAGAKPEQLVPQVSDYLQVLGSATDAFQVKDSFLKVSVADGIFSKWLILGTEVAKATDWSMIPGDANKIAETYLLPEWRKVKSPALLAYWDSRIAREGAAASAARLEFQQTTFANVRKPALLWQRSQDLIILDQPNRASQEMLGLIKAYPNHPDVATWIATLQKQLDPSKI